MGKAKEGHNAIQGDKVEAFVLRLEQINREKEALAEDYNEILEEAERVGLDKKILKTIVKIRKDKAQFEMDLAAVDLYMTAMGQQLVLDFGSHTSAIEDLSEAA
jgi:uncharacterized protein (UPF0335 family)